MRSVRVSVDGVQWEIPFKQISALDVRDFYKEVGRISLRDSLAPGADLDIDVIAAWAWLTLRREAPGLTYEQVAGEISFDAVAVVEVIDEDGDDG